MGLVNISAFAGINDFWWNNWNDHLEIVEAINKAMGLNLPTYVIHPWQEGDQAGILERHQQLHNDMQEALGIQGSDLQLVDFGDPSSRDAWVYSNYQQHLQARTILGI